MTNMIKLEELFQTLESKDNNIRYEAFKKLLELTEQKVDWVYDYWQTLVDKLSSGNSYHRSIGLMLLANLTLSDSEDKFSEIGERYFSFFNDEKFITARQCLQNVWRVAVNKEVYRLSVIEALQRAYSGNVHLERNPNLIKQDIIFSLKKISNFYKDSKLDSEIEALILNETDKKIQKSLRDLIVTA